LLAQDFADICIQVCIRYWTMTIVMVVVMIVVMIESTGMFLGLVSKMGALVESIPQFVLGGAGLVMFGMVAATGVRIL